MAASVGQRSGEQFIMRKECRQGSESGFGSGGCRPAVLDNSREPGAQHSEESRQGLRDPAKNTETASPCPPAWRLAQEGRGFCFSHQEEKDNSTKPLSPRRNKT